VQDWQKDKQEGEAQLILEVAVQGPDKPWPTPYLHI
jgi:hypothetical protein